MQTFQFQIGLKKFLQLKKLENYKTKINDVKNGIPSITNLATTAPLNAKKIRLKSKYLVLLLLRLLLLKIKYSILVILNISYSILVILNNHSPFIDNIWCFNLADMQLISKFNKGISCSLCAIGIFSKDA